MIPDNLTIVVAVIGMVVLTIVASSLVTAYQRHLMYKRQRIQRLVNGAQRMEDLLARMTGVSLPRDIRLLLRRDILDRFRSIRHLYKGYPAIEQMIQQAQQRLKSEGGDVGQVLPVPPDATTYEQWQTGFTELLDLLQHGGLLKPLAPDLGRSYREALLERQAETLYGHFMNQADQFKQEGREMVARGRVQQLQELLRGLGLASERVQSLQVQAEEAYQYLLNGPAAVGGVSGSVNKA